MLNYFILSYFFEPNSADNFSKRSNQLVTEITDTLKINKVDLLILPELCLSFDKLSKEPLKSIKVKSKIIYKLKQICIKYNTNICFPFLENIEGKNYNTAIYINRNGEIAGKYHKVFLIKDEIDAGLTPGEINQKCIKIDNINIATSICFDENFPELIENWRRQDINLIIFPAYTYSGELIRSWAIHLGSPLISCFPWLSTSYDNDGHILSNIGTETALIKNGSHPKYSLVKINLNSKIYHIDYNHYNINNLLHKYSNDITIKLMPHEARFKLTVNSNKLKIEELEQEHNLIPINNYLLESKHYTKLTQ